MGGLSGIVIQRKEGKWSASELREDAHQKQVETTRLEPRKSWDHAWATLEEKGLLTLPDFSTLPPSDYAVLDGSSIVVEVFTTGKYRTYMYPNPGQFDNPECRLIEILTATLMKEIRRGDGRVNGRSFLSAQEVRKLGDKIYALKYPLPITDFLKTLPIDLAARGLRSDGSSGDEGISWKEWPLTSRVEPRGYFALVAFTQAKGFRDHEGENTVRHAEVVFHDRNLFQSLVLQPSDYPTRRSPEPPSVK